MARWGWSIFSGEDHHSQGFGKQNGGLTFWKMTTTPNIVGSMPSLAEARMREGEGGGRSFGESTAALELNEGRQGVRRYGDWLGGGGGVSCPAAERPRNRW